MSQFGQKGLGEIGYSQGPVWKFPKGRETLPIPPCTWMWPLPEMCRNHTERPCIKVTWWTGTPPPAPPGYVFIPSVSVQKDGTNSLLPHKLTRGQTLQRALICLAIEETRKKPPLTAACAYPWAMWWAHQSFPSAARAS